MKPAPQLACVIGEKLRDEIQCSTYGQTNFFGRGGMRHRIKISGGSKRQAIDGGLRTFSGHNGIEATELGADAGRGVGGLAGADARTPGSHRMDSAISEGRI